MSDNPIEDGSVPTGDGSGPSTTASEREFRKFMADTRREMAEIRNKMDHFDGETGEIRLLVEKYEARIMGKFCALDSVAETDEAIVSFFNKIRLYTLTVLQCQTNCTT